MNREKFKISGRNFYNAEAVRYVKHGAGGKLTAWQTSSEKRREQETGDRFNVRYSEIQSPY